MSQEHERLPALGQPVEEPTPDGDHDFAGEHDATAVDQDITAGQDSDAEEESPAGSSGFEP